mgnify:CR=1 FL=1
MPYALTPTHLIACASLAAATFLAVPTALAQEYDVNAIQQEKAQIQEYFNKCQQGFGAGMDQNFQNFLMTGQYNVTPMGGGAEGCDENTLTQMIGRSYQLDLMLARANGDTRDPCEIERMPGCPEPGQ